MSARDRNKNTEAEYCYSQLVIVEHAQATKTASKPSSKRTTPYRNASDYEIIVHDGQWTVGSEIDQSFLASKIHAAQWAETMQPQPGVTRMLNPGPVIAPEI